VTEFVSAFPKIFRIADSYQKKATIRLEIWIE